MDPELALEARLRGGVLLSGELDRDVVRRRLSSGELVRAGRRALLASTTPESFAQRLHVIEAEVGHPMWFTGATAVRLYGSPHAPSEPQVVRLLVPVTRDPGPVTGVEIIRARQTDLAGARRQAGHPVVALEVGLRHCATEVTHQKLVTLVQDELRLRRTTERRLRSATGRGRVGSTALRRALEVAGDGSHSRQERRVHRRMALRGVRGYHRGVNLVSSRGVSYWIDFLWAALRAGLEVNGALHLDPLQAAYDARRARRVLTEHDVVLLNVTADEVDADPDGAVDEVIAFLTARATALGVPRSVFEC